MNGEKSRNRVAVGRKVLFAVIVIMLGGLLLPTGCADARLWSASLDRVISDGAGGAITLYGIMKGANRRDFYVQRISPSGEKMWEEEGTFVGTADKGSVAAAYVRMVTDGSSGAIIVQTDWGYAAGKRTTRVTRVDSSGKLLWQRDSGLIDRIVADGRGGAVVARVDGTTIAVNRFDSTGRMLWGDSGTVMQRPRYGTVPLELASAGDGGAIVAWLETDPARAKPGQPVTSEEVHAQRIGPDGSLVWGTDGATVYIAPEGAGASWLRMAGGEADDAILAWEQSATVSLQKLSSAGAGLWGPNAVMLGSNGPVGPGNPPLTAPLVLGDDAGGAIVTWQIIRPGAAAVYAQKVSASGDTRWQAGGVKTVDIPAGSAYSLHTVGDGSGGVIISINFRDLLDRSQGIRMQKLDADGNTAWLAEPVGISVDVTLGTYDAISDGQGGMLLAWATRKTDMSDAEVTYVQRIGSNGDQLWGKDGIRLGE